MAKKVLILDTSILCVWLQIPEMDIIQKKGLPPVTYADVVAKIESEVARSTRIVLPYASIIECGNHITQIKRRDSQAYVDKFAEFIDKAIAGTEPWDIFTNQTALFTPERLNELVTNWKVLSKERISMGDCSILQVANHYDSLGISVEIFTGDAGLEARQPAPKQPMLPRNHRRR